jgi:hypothetical protein
MARSNGSSACQFETPWADVVSWIVGRKILKVSERTSASLAQSSVFEKVVEKALYSALPGSSLLV